MKLMEVITEFSHPKDEEPTVRLLDVILHSALTQRANAIYFKPCPEEPETRYLAFFKVKLSVQALLELPKFEEGTQLHSALPQSVIDPIIERLRRMARVNGDAMAGKIPVRLKDNASGFSMNYDLNFEIIPTLSGQPQIYLRIEYIY